MIPYYIVFSLFSIPSLYFNYSLSKRAVQSHIFLYEKNPGDGEPTGYILFRGKIFGWAVYLVALGLALFALFR